MLGDFIRRAMEFSGYEVLQVMNITDIGHLISDGDDGDDKMTKALKREGKEITLENMLSVADFYAQAFKQDLESLNIKTPHHFPKASDHIQESIDIIEKLSEKEFTYETSDGLYFDTARMPDYGKLGGTNIETEGESRIGENSEKRNQADFALWKKDSNHGWQSPWGQGFPGWHIECSGMSMKYLGERFDIHTGGSDLRSIHHNNEIAQSECATGCNQFVNIWMHGEMLNFGGAKLSKSTGGNIRIQSVIEKDISPIAYRYLALQTHYRSPMNFTWEILESAQNGLQKIYKDIIRLKQESAGIGGIIDIEFNNLFIEKINDDINLPQAVAVMHGVLKSDISAADKLATLYHFDTVLGLELADQEDVSIEIPAKIQTLLDQRATARSDKNWELSDALRDQISELGYRVLDNNGEQKIEKK